MAKKKAAKPKVPSKSVDVEVSAVEPKVSATITNISGIPLAPVTKHGYLPSAMNLGKGFVRLTPVQRTNLKRLTRGLDDAGAKIDGKKHVRNASDAIRWMLEQLSTD